MLNYNYHYKRNGRNESTEIIYQTGKIQKPKPKVRQIRTPQTIKFSEGDILDMKLLKTRTYIKKRNQRYDFKNLVEKNISHTIIDSRKIFDNRYFNNLRNIIVKNSPSVIIAINYEALSSTGIKLLNNLSRNAKCFIKIYNKE